MIGITWLRGKLNEFKQAHVEAEKIRNENLRAIESGQCSPAQLDDITVKVEAAKKGDSKTVNGTQRLVLPMALVFLALNGCGPSHNTVEEADREGLDVQRQIIIAQDEELDRIEQALADDHNLKSPSLMPIVERMREKNEDAKAIVAQLLANFHPPQQPKVYAHAEVQSLLKRMHDAHQVTFWAGVGTALLTGAGIVIAAARSPIAKMIPGVGTILTSLDGTMAAVETWMHKMKESGKPELAAGLAGVLDAAHQDPKVAAYIDKKLGKIQVGTLAPHPEVQLSTSLAADAAVEALVNV